MTVTLRTKICAGIALLAFVGTQSLHADLRDDLLEVFETSDIAEARTMIDAAKKAGRPEGWYLSGRLNMLGFNFSQAQKDFAEYRRLAKAKKYSRFDSEVTEALEGVAEGNLQFDRFQDIVVIDAVKVNKDKFFKHLRLPLSAGRVVSASEIPGETSGRGVAGFISEGGDFMMWSQTFPAEKDSEDDDNEEYPSDADVSYMVEANVLTDGSLSAPKAVENLGEDADYPFLTGDGTTLYYSAYGDNSVGGRDIFIATRDAATGEYRQPVNAGMPFNSSADDYLLAVDEENGVGWWATDRHLLDEEVMLYVFLLPEGRKNFEGTSEEKRERGVLDDIRVTWIAQDSEDEDTDDDDESEISKTPEQLEQEQAEREKHYREKAAEIRKIQPGLKPRRHDCRIPVGPGKYIYSVDDVRSESEKRLVGEYIRAEKNLAALKSDLDRKRRTYSVRPDNNLGSEIITLEKQVENGKIEVTTILSALYKELGVGRRK